MVLEPSGILMLSDVGNLAGMVSLILSEFYLRRWLDYEAQTVLPLYCLI